MPDSNRCRWCGSVISREALVCPICGRKFPQADDDIAPRQPEEQDHSSPYDTQAPQEQGYSSPYDTQAPQDQDYSSPYAPQPPEGQGYTPPYEPLTPEGQAPAPQQAEPSAPRPVTRPVTIEELKRYCAEHGMPLEKMRFFIGEDYREPRAFGIYREGDRFVVYKNKANGNRAVRYHGPDEAYAVSELFSKLLDECHKRGIYPDGAPTVNGGAGRSFSRPKKRGNGRMLIVFLVIAALFVGYRFFSHRHDGYYRFGSDAYYLDGSTWYYYTGSYWSEYYNDPFDYYTGYDYDDSFIGSDYDSSWGYGDVEDSYAWDENHSSSSSSSDYDSWDSFDTDWDSDW